MQNPGRDGAKGVPLLRRIKPAGRVCRKWKAGKGGAAPECMVVHFETASLFCRKPLLLEQPTFYALRVLQKRGKDGRSQKATIGLGVLCFPKPALEYAPLNGPCREKTGRNAWFRPVSKKAGRFWVREYNGIAGAAHSSPASRFWARADPDRFAGRGPR